MFVNIPFPEHVHWISSFYCSRVISFSVHMTSFTTELFQHVTNPHAQVGLKILSMSACLKGFTSTEYRSDLCFAPTCRSFAQLKFWLNPLSYLVIKIQQFLRYSSLPWIGFDLTLLFPNNLWHVCPHVSHTRYGIYMFSFYQIHNLGFSASLYYKANSIAITVADTEGNLFYSGTSTEASNLCGYVSGLLHASAYIHCYSLIAGRFVQAQNSILAGEGFHVAEVEMFGF